MSDVFHTITDLKEEKDFVLKVYTWVDIKLFFLFFVLTMTTAAHSQNTSGGLKDIFINNSVQKLYFLRISRPVVKAEGLYTFFESLFSEVRMCECFANVLHDNLVPQCWCLVCFDQNDNEVSSGKSIASHPGSKIGHLACCESGYFCRYREPLLCAGQASEDRRAEGKRRSDDTLIIAQS